MKNFKKIAAIVLSTVMVLGLATGCQKPAEPEAEPAPVVEEPAAEPEAEPEPEPTAEPVELFVSAAASMTDVLQAIAEEYNKENPEVNITFTFDSSGTLQTQIEEGAPADLFISAAQKQMDALAEKSLIDDATRADLLVNKVVLIEPVDSDLGLTSFEEVATDKVSMVAIGNDTVPVGQYTQAIFEHLGTWDVVSAKANLGENVRAVLAWVETAEVECGIVYETDAKSTDLVKVVAEAPEGSHDPVIYPAAVLAEAAQPEAAKAFLDYLSTDAAVQLFTDAGFTMYQ